MKSIKKALFTFILSVFSLNLFSLNCTFAEKTPPFDGVLEATIEGTSIESAMDKDVETGM